MNARPIEINPGITDLFGPVVYAYTRRQALEDGVQVEVTNLAREVGFTVRIFVTRAVVADYVTVPDGVTGQDEMGRLWDILTLAWFAARRAPSDQDTLSFILRVQMPGGLRVVRLWMQIGAVDIDNPAPAVTIMTENDL